MSHIPQPQTVSPQSTQRGTPPDTSSLVSLRDVGVCFGGHRVLHHVDIDVGPGSFTTLVGPNGAGKTTCARVICGLEAPTSGTVYRQPGLRTGYAPQNMSVPHSLPLTVGRFISLHPKSSKTAMVAALAEVEASHLIDRPVHSLSGGEKQRTILARALLGDPHLLVLDEPAQGLDTLGCDRLFRLISHLRRNRHCACLMISHDLHVVSAYSDHVVCLNGHVCCQGPPQSIDAHPDYQRLFPTHLRESHAVYVHRHDHSHGMGPSHEPPP